MSLTELLGYKLSIGDFSISLFQVFIALIIFLVARIASRIITRVVKRLLKRRKSDEGRTYAILKFITYFIYFIAFLLGLQAIGVSLSVLLAGSAALLVGVGFGLQQTFNDFVSGFLLLIEGTVEVGDDVLVDGLVGTVKRIGLRTSRVQTRNDVSIIIPNSKLVGDNVINWSHESHATRFQVDVGVSYHSDVNLVTELLLEAAFANKRVLERPLPYVVFKDFGESSLDFTLHFYSRDYLKVETVKSELRFRIWHLFKEHYIEIPFPQRDVWIKNEPPEPGQV